MSEWDLDGWGVAMRFPCPLAQKKGKTRSRRGAEGAENGQNAFFDTTESQCLAIGCLAYFHFHLCALCVSAREKDIKKEEYPAGAENGLLMAIAFPSNRGSME
jgi:hypothetical protein